MNKINKNSMLVIAVVALLLFCVLGLGKGSKTSSYRCNREKYSPLSPDKKVAAGVTGADVADADDDYAPADLSGTNINLDIGCAMESGVGLASSLLPREVASQEDFGQFAPDDILKGQNFLDPRNQIGYPETIGGTLRNANQQIRAEPPNPKQPHTWNNSTIVPDLMQRKICT